jgi:hypothetical protein
MTSPPSSKAVPDVMAPAELEARCAREAASLEGPPRTD